MSNKQVPIGIRPGIRLPHNIEGVEVLGSDMLIDLETKQRLMSLRPGLFLKGDPDWPKKVVSVEIVADAETKETAEERPKKGSKKSDSDNPA